MMAIDTVATPVNVPLSLPEAVLTQIAHDLDQIVGAAQRVQQALGQARRTPGLSACAMAATPEAAYFVGLLDMGDD